jgi:hypothetical protein
MEASSVRRFALGPSTGDEVIGALGSELSASDHVFEAPDGRWLSTSSVELRDRAKALLGSTYTVVEIECWNSVAEGTTIGRLRVETHRDGAVTTESSERSYPSLARAGVLGDVASEWLVEKVRALARPTREPGPTRREITHRDRAEAFLTALVEQSVLQLAPGSAVRDLGDRTRRILFVNASKRPEAVKALLLMFGSSRHVVPSTMVPADLDGALDRINYRR